MSEQALDKVYIGLADLIWFVNVILVITVLVFVIGACADANLILARKVRQRELKLKLHELDRQCQELHIEVTDD